MTMSRLYNVAQFIILVMITIVIFTVGPPGPPLGPALVIRIKHKCHPFWETETVLYQGLTEDFFTNTQIHGEEPWEKGDAK